jgi:hypothetical protein
MKIHNRFRRRGAVTVMTAVCMTMLLGIVALALDGGHLMMQRGRAQAAADAAALAGATDLYDNYWTGSGDDLNGSAEDSALLTAAANGFQHNGNDIKVFVNIPPTEGPYKDKRGYVEVLIEYHQPAMFSRIFASEGTVVRARAVALGSSVAADVGILVLDPDDKGAFNAQGGGISTVAGTPIVVNSNHAEAAIAGGGGTVIADDFFITGGVGTTGGGTFQGEVHTGRPGLEDPLQELPVPDPTQMTVQSTKKIQYTSGTIDLQPGVYKGGINVSGTASLNLAPGIYYMDGGGFSFSGQGSLYGEGVMIYNDPGNGQADGINVSGQGSLVLKGPTSGIYQGITFFQDRTSNVSGSVSGTGGTTDITGTFYFAGAQLSVSGNGGVANIGSQYISRLLELGGNGGINIDWAPDKVARARNLYLVE